MKAERNQQLRRGDRWIRDTWEKRMKRLKIPDLPEDMRKQIEAWADTLPVYDPEVDAAIMRGVKSDHIELVPDTGPLK